mmetsp:Transcript_6232/g.26110  ORF Transcript_6232/g.26110 Transcript_6232/m.26110 type:complete len:526 (+) Transcript_6232:1260-2837(+)
MYSECGIIIDRLLRDAIEERLSRCCWWPTRSRRPAVMIIVRSDDHGLAGSQARLMSREEEPWRHHPPRPPAFEVVLADDPPRRRQRGLLWVIIVRRRRQHRRPRDPVRRCRREEGRGFSFHCVVLESSRNKGGALGAPTLESDSKLTRTAGVCFVFLRGRPNRPSSSSSSFARDRGRRRVRDEGAEDDEHDARGLRPAHGGRAEDPVPQQDEGDLGVEEPDDVHVGRLEQGRRAQVERHRKRDHLEQEQHRQKHVASEQLDRERRVVYAERDRDEGDRERDGGLRRRHGRGRRVAQLSGRDDARRRVRDGERQRAGVPEGSPGRPHRKVRVHQRAVVACGGVRRTRRRHREKLASVMMTAGRTTTTTPPEAALMLAPVEAHRARAGEARHEPERFATRRPCAVQNGVHGARPAGHGEHEAVRGGEVDVGHADDGRVESEAAERRTYCEPRANSSGRRASTVRIPRSGRRRDAEREEDGRRHGVDAQRHDRPVEPVGRHVLGVEGLEARGERGGEDEASGDRVRRC